MRRCSASTATSSRRAERCARRNYRGPRDITAVAEQVDRLSRPPRAARRTDRTASARHRHDRRPQLGRLVRYAASAIPGGRAGPARARPQRRSSSRFPPRRLRRRRGGADECARHRTVHRDRLLDGRADRSAAVAQAPRTHQWAGVMRQLPQLPRDPDGADGIAARTRAHGRGPDESAAVRARCRRLESDT